MNQMVGKSPAGRQFLILELEPGNVARLRQDMPIRISVEDMFPEGIPKKLELILAYTETPTASARLLREHAAVTLDERTRIQEAKRPNCPRCESTIEQLGRSRSDDSPVDVYFCQNCGCALGILPKGQ